MHDHDHGDACCTSCAQGNACEGPCRQENPPGCSQGICAMPNPAPGIDIAPAGTFISEADQEAARATATAYRKGYAEGNLHGLQGRAPGVSPVLVGVGGLLLGALVVRWFGR